MLSLLTTATPPKATTGAAPGAALPGGRADESPDASGGFARALQDSSAALQPPDARAGQTGTDTDAQARGGRTDRPRALGLAGGTPPGLDPSTHGGRSAARTGRGPAGSQDDPATGDPAAAAAAAVASLLPAADPAASAALPAPAIASGDLPPHAASAAHAAGADHRDATHGADSVARRLTGGPAEAGPAFAAPPISRPGPAVATPESATQPGTTEPQQASDVADTLAAKLAGNPAADASASAGTPPATGPATADGAAAAGSPAATATPPAPSAIPLPAALNPTAMGGPAAADRADAARRAITATPRGATASDARAATGEARRASGRADSSDTPGTTAAPAVMAGAAPTVRPAAADPGRAAASDAALDRSATEPGGTAANGSSAATGTAPATTPLPRFAEQFQAALAAAPTTAPTTTPRTAEAPEAARAQLGPPLASPEFPPALGAQVSLFARSGVERATIEISPPEIGPISVQIALDGSAARVDFLADAAATRQVIEASLPTLASALREAGLTLSGGGVFQQPQSSAGSGGQGGTGQPGHGHAGRPAAADDGQGGPGPATVLRTTAQRGLVDLVA
jgi:flagellar hook-length control protein FliK